MDLLLSVKGGDVTAWRAVEDFAAAYRQALLDRAASDRSGRSEAVFSETRAALDTIITTHRDLLKRLQNLIEAASASSDPKELTVTFYSDLYRHFEHVRSVPAFFQLSMAFLHQVSAAIIAQATDQLGPQARNLPEMALIAVGPAGRCEYSPYCPLQLLLVHGDAAAAQSQSIAQFCHALHAGFEHAGLLVDPVVTPRNALWRGTLSEWRHRCEEGLHSLTDSGNFIDLGRLVDQYPLHPVDRFAGELKRISGAALNGNRPALANLVVRMSSLSNGLGFMGRLKLKRSGAERGKFNLLDHGLVPYSAALSALTLIRGSAAVGTWDRIHDLLKRHEVDVEMAERMLTTWHSLHSFRLLLEQSFHADEPTKRPLFLDPDDLSVDQQQELKKQLESVAAIQHYVEIIFSGMEE